MSTTLFIQTASISTALAAAGAIANISLFDIPLLVSQPASRSLPLIRWLFSRGSHIFPTAAFLSTTGFAYLSYTATPSPRSLGAFLSSLTGGAQPTWYAAAAILTLGIAPWTTLVMLPSVNSALIEKNEGMGGKRSAGALDGATRRSLEGSLGGVGDRSQWRDTSGPQERTEEHSTQEEDEEVRGLLERFGRLNKVRAGLIGVGGVFGLVGALR